MSSFIVVSGALLEIGCPSTLDRSTESQVSFTRTLGGKRKGFIRRGGRRSWTVDVAVARPAEVATIETITRNGGPVAWYGPEAVIGNLLSPQASGLDEQPNETDLGLVQLPGGRIARAVTSTRLIFIGGPGTYAVGERIHPGPTGVVSAGVWVRGAGQPIFRCLDGSGGTIQNINGSTGAGPDWQWVTVTGTVPAGTAVVELCVAGSTAIAAPSVSWGPVPRDEGGTGCPAAVIHSATHSPIALWEGANYTASSYSVTEVA